MVVVGLDTIYTSSLKNRKPTNDNIFNNEFNSIDENGTWNFNSMTTNSLTLPIIGDVETAIQGKEPTIRVNGLSITQTAGLQDALDNKYNDTGGTIDGSVDITGNLLVGTINIINEIGTKQDEITTSTDLISNSITLPIIGDVKTSIQGNTDNILTNTNNLSGVQTRMDPRGFA